jgi:YD repeat-containing protein
MTSTWRIIVLLVLVAWSVPSLLADCEPGTPSPSVSISYIGPDPTGDGTALVSYSFPNMTSASKRQLELKIDGNIWTSFGAPQQSGVWEADVNTTCWTAGTHTLAARATSLCNPQLTASASTSVTVSTKPSVSISYSHDAMGHGVISVPYDFPNTSSPAQRQLNLKVDGGNWTTIGAPQVSGVWNFPFDVTCWTGTHVLGIVAHACGNTGPAFSDTDTTSVTAQSKPSVSISYSELNGGVASVTYDFPNTGQRLLQLYIDGAFAGSHQPSATNGVWPAAVGTCWKKLRVVATSCGQGANPQFTAEDEFEQPEKKIEPIQVALLKVPGGNIQATVTWNNVIVNGTINVKLQNWTNAAGQPIAGGTLKNITATASSGKDVFTFPRPPGVRQLSVVASAPTACGIATDDASIKCDPCEATANPVYWSDGNMRLTDGESLPAIGGHGLARTYDSEEQAGGLFGRGWTTLFERRLVAHGDGAISIVTETNEVVTFRPVLGVFRQTWPRSGRARGTLAHNSAAGTYTYRAPAATEVAIFRASDGRLVTLRDTANAREAAIAYDVQGRPSTFTDAVTGVSWNLTIDAERRVTSIGVAGHPELSWSYSYDGNGNLLTVLAPGSVAWRTYEYAADRMTASRDALGNLIESHTYDADGYAISSTGDIDEIASLEYGLPGSAPDERVTRVTYRTGAVAEYTLRAVGSAWRSVQISGGCASCGTHDATYVRDAQGRVIREQGADGYITVTTYANGRVQSDERALKPAGCDPQMDAQHCRLETDALASAVLEPTGATVQAAYEYADPLWPDRMTAVIRPSVGVAGQVRREDYFYHPATGALMNATVCGWTAGDAECSERTTLTTFYEGGASGLAPAFDPGGVFQSAWLALPQPSFMTKSIDGPRTDIEDVSSLVYYPIDASVTALLRGRLAATKNAAGHITRYESYDVFGNATRVVDPNGVAMEMTFNALGRLVTTTTKGAAGCNTALDPLCATDLTTASTYSPSSGPLLRQERPGGGGMSYTYDSRGRAETMSRGPSAANLRERVETSYDPLTAKKSLERTLRYEGGSWVEKSWQSFSYDSQARLQTVTHADGAAIHYTYDAEDRVATIRDENHAEPNTTYAYDPSGRLASVRQTLAGAPGGVISTQYAYDTAGNLISVTDPNGNVTSYVYDDFGQMTTQSSPVTGTTTYEYDEGGNLTQMTDANGASTERTYDAANRVLTAVSARQEVTETVQWAYDSTAAGAYGVGRLATMEDPSGSTAYSYERRGFLRQETRTILGSTYVQSYGYDANGNRTSVGYPSGRVVTYSFDDAGRPLTATGTMAGQQTSYVAAAAYLPFGPMTSLTLGNGTTETRAYDARYLPLTNSLTNGVTTFAQYSYTTDPAGNITAIGDGTSAGYSRTFGYDDLNRLTTANTGSALWGTGSFTYDRMGNMLSATLGATNRSFTYQGTTSRINTATGLTTTMSYDAAGNELSTPAGNPGAEPAAFYSPRNLLRSQFVREYDRCVEEYGSACLQPDPVQEWRSNVYDGRGLRVLSTRDIVSIGPNGIEDPEPQVSVYFYTPELTMLNVVASTTGRTADVIWFGSRPVADHEGATLRYTFTDHLGTPILQTTSNGAVVWRVEYEPFGNVYTPRDGSNAGDQPLRFPGQQVAYSTAAGEESYNVHRWYRSGWGRYSSVDPLVPGGLGHFERGRMSRFMPPGIAAREWFRRENAEISTPAVLGMLSMGRRPTPKGLSDAVNPYAYAAGSPVMYTDPLGLAPCLTYSENAVADYIPAGPPGKTFKGCRYIGLCYGMLLGYEKETDPGCKCKQFCLMNIDPATGIPIGPDLCFNMPPWWASSPPLINP